MSVAARDRVAICIPNWNHAKFLPRSIGSAVAAAHRLAEIGVGCDIIVIDDASRDGSQRLLLSLALQEPEGIIDIILSERNHGLAASRNRLIAHAKARYICFLDADNELFPDNLPIFLRAIRETGAAVVYGALLRHDGRKSVGFLSNDFVHEQIYEHNYIDAFALYDADVLRKVGGFQEDLRSHEDWDMFLHLIAEGKELIFVPVCMGYYFVNDNSMLANDTFQHKDMHRIYNQRNTGFPLSWRNSRKMYHPDIGWLARGD
jgi:glycosyltransferase involved in cell wall biosynthesis